MKIKKLKKKKNRFTSIKLRVRSLERQKETRIVRPKKKFSVCSAMETKNQSQI
jgi:hypothetical protein